jgi:DedD protein
MQTNQPRERKKKPFLWIVVVAVLLAAAFVLYALSMRTYPLQGPDKAVVRGKIPPPPPPLSSAMDSLEGPSISTESALPTGAGNSESAFGTPNDMESTPASFPGDSPQQSAPESQPEMAVPPQEEAADTVQTPADDAEFAGATGSSHGPASSPGADDARPAATAADELQVSVQETPESQPSPEAVASAPPDSSAADPQPAPATSSPGDTEPVARYAIQVGAYRAKDNADLHVAKLQEKGFDAYLYETSDKKQRAWYFVRFGRFQDFKSAHKAWTTFTEKERMDATIVRSNSQ